MSLTVHRQSRFAPRLPAYAPYCANYSLLLFSPAILFSDTYTSSSIGSSSAPLSIASIIALPMKSPIAEPWVSDLESGFTLVEIVVVVIIISIFAGMISLSVGSSESRKNHAFYEHLTDSLNYVRLLSVERMQPMGLSLQADKQGKVIPVIVTLSNPYAHYQTPFQTTDDQDSVPKNAMELTADILGTPANQAPTPSWEREPDVTLPELPAGVSLSVQSLEATRGNNARAQLTNSAVGTLELQPWFTGQSVPQVLWFGTGQAAPVTIEVRHQSRLVGEVITIMPDGSVMLGQEQ